MGNGTAFFVSIGIRSVAMTAESCAVIGCPEEVEDKWTDNCEGHRGDLNCLCCRIYSEDLRTGYCEDCAHKKKPCCAK